MARHKKEDEQVQSLSNNPVENLPEKAGEMTQGAAKTAKPAEHRGSAKALESDSKGEPKPEPELPEESEGGEPEESSLEAALPPEKWFRVTADKMVMGQGGFRTMLRMGKEVSSRMYNIAKLRSQGVKLEPIDASEVSTL